MSKQLDPLRTTAPELHPNRTIIIVGDSWGCGEWTHGVVTHRGLEKYLLDDGYDVINYSIGGGSNSLSYLMLLKAVSHEQIDKKNTKVFFFLTDWHRDLWSQKDIYNRIIDFGGLAKCTTDHRWLLESYDENTAHRFFYRIFQEMQMLELPLGVIGGCIDAILIGDAHPPLYTACQSFVNLCIHDNDCVDDPVHTVFSDPNFFGSELKRSLHFVNDMDKANARRLQWQHNPQWFCPDGVHANRHGHLKLYNFLKTKNYL